MRNSNRNLFLCAGTQSSGSTLISWCFLQRHDMNGILDADNDLLIDIPAHWGTPHTWYKTTISSFRLTELVVHYQDAGWQVHPLLVLRDARQVWASLAKKRYGRNGITAEDPPLRIRLRRFKEDWELFRRQGWPMIRYESFVTEPEPVLQRICSELELQWDPAMMTWPKDRASIAGTKHGNKTFRETRGRGLLETLKAGPETLSQNAIPPADLLWLEREFAEFNGANDYPTQVQLAAASAHGSERSVPSYELTRRFKWEMRRKPLRWIMHSLGFRHELPKLPASK